MTAMDEPVVSALTWEQVLSFAQAGECWICGKVGLKRVANHTATVHDLTADEIRERYGLKWTQGLCTPEYAAEQSVRSKDAGCGQSAPHPSGQSVHPHRPLGPQAKAGLKEKANRPDQKAALAERNRDPEFNAKRAEGLRRSTLAAEQRSKAQAAALAKRASMPRSQRTCSVDNCDQPHLARGYCGRHYRRFMKYGTDK